MVLATTSMGLRASLDAYRAAVAGMIAPLNVDEAACKRCAHGVCYEYSRKGLQAACLQHEIDGLSRFARQGFAQQQR